MKSFLSQPGFLGTNASIISDISLVLIIFTAILFTIGSILARSKHFKAHQWVQTLAVILNAIVVILVMIKPFIVYFIPQIPAKLLQKLYAITTFHALIGTIALVFGIFVVLRGNNLVPKGLRFKNYKLYMWISYGFYLLTTITGVFVYIFMYV
jgi:uncharacterized membrane protein YozB (DUF420 family)